MATKIGVGLRQEIVQIIRENAPEEKHNLENGRPANDKHGGRHNWIGL